MRMPDTAPPATAPSPGHACATCRAAVVFSPAFAHQAGDLANLLAGAGDLVQGGPIFTEVPPGPDGADEAAACAVAAADTGIILVWTGDIRTDAQFARSVRRRGFKRIVFAMSECTALGEALAIDGGCDDVWPRPRDPEELVVRIRHAFDFERRVVPPRTRRLGNLALDDGQRAFRVDGRDGWTRLTSIEFALLGLLMENGKEGVSIADFRRLRTIEDVPGKNIRGTPGPNPTAGGARNARDVHLSHIRTKLVEAGAGLDIVVREKQALLVERFPVPDRRRQAGGSRRQKKEESRKGTHMTDTTELDLRSICAEAAFRTEAPTLMRLHLAAKKRRMAAHLANDAAGIRMTPIVRILEAAVWKDDGTAADWDERVFLAIAQLDATSIEEMKRLCESEAQRVSGQCADGAMDPSEFTHARLPYVYLDELAAVLAFAERIAARRAGR